MSWRFALMIAAAIVSTSAVAQALAPAPNSRQMRPQLPAGIRPKPGHGERLMLQSATGTPQIVRLHCALGPYSLVMLPTGDLKFIEADTLRPATDPFVPATADVMTESLKAAGLSKHKYSRGQFYLYAYECSEGFFMHAQSILESMLPGVVADLKGWGLKIERPETPLVVVIMPSRAAYDAFRPMPKEVIAYFDVMSNYIVMYEDQELWDAAPEYAARQASYVIAHEGVHQLLANTGVQKRLSQWPPWLSEGMAEYYCPLKINSNLVRKGNAELPHGHCVGRRLGWSTT